MRKAALLERNNQLERSLAAGNRGGQGLPAPAPVKVEVVDPPAWGNRYKLNDATWELIKVRPKATLHGVHTTENGAENRGRGGVGLGAGGLSIARIIQVSHSGIHSIRHVQEVMACNIEHNRVQ